MKDLLDKISSYNLFNYLLPGIIFSLIADKLMGYSLIQSDIILGAFLYYFIGLIISRIGSLIIEPILKKIKFIKFASYSDFVIYSNKDDKLNVLSEVNNTYRTITSMFFLLFLLRIYKYVSQSFAFHNNSEVTIILILLFIMFLFSYRKQTRYITDRINSLKERKQKNNN